MSNRLTVGKSKEKVGNSWTVSKVILGHKYHHKDTIITWVSIFTDYSQNSQQKVIFFIYFCLWLSVRVGACCHLTFDLVSQSQRERFLSAYFGKTIVLTTQRSQIAFFSVVFNCRSLFNEAAYLAALRRLRSPFAICDADSKQSKTKIFEKNSPFGCNW